ncbi:MAG: tRNA-binding protein [Candidatus Diapherotrites archaeon]|nr:tRNA-binding protein [Candidatus Diapherotrites archaeon]
METINYSDFEKLDIRVGKIIEVLDFPEARKPAYKLKIDLGKEIGIKWSSAQLVQNYSKKELIGKQVLCVVNFPEKNICLFKSQVLTLGIPNEQGNCVLITIDQEVPLGGKLY